MWQLAAAAIKELEREIRRLVRLAVSSCALVRELADAQKDASRWGDRVWSGQPNGRRPGPGDSYPDRL
ncbi:hypothetical protein BOX15_Mlig029446g1 [Macrostomum lignano]|uniref:Uncharacterized protein n=1 Tax=Macrostomum lignano TaxID=282301 RepID=A0A267FIH7_9PLAT|nr:hypothetical protein BOX15_Mlig029446g1 [Macrostomum lignano]